MKRPLVVALPGQDKLGERVAEEISGDLAAGVIRSFPDGETYVRILSPVEGRPVILAGTLDQPNQRALPLMMVARTLRDLRPLSMGLATPYLPYLRQDARFHPGEGLTSRYFGELLSGLFDWLVTVDPHLHRLDTLRGTYSIPHRLVSSGAAVARWVGAQVPNPLLVGPDEESEQWVEPIAAAGGFRRVILKKERSGDFDVEVSALPVGDAPPGGWASYTPVLIDDIISTGRTMVEAIKSLQDAGMPAPICLGIHGLFVEDAREVLETAGAARVVTCNTVAHETNQIDVLPDLAAAVEAFLHDGEGS